MFSPFHGCDAECDGALGRYPTDWREPGGAGGSSRESEHEKAAEPKPKTPDIDLGK